MPATKERTTRTTRGRATKATATDNSENAKLRAELSAGVDELLDQVVNGTSERTLEFAAWIAQTRATAHRSHGVFKLWSIHNRLMLDAQVRRRGASVKDLFAGVAQWRALGREVVEDQVDHPYRIWAMRPLPDRNNAAAQNAQQAAQPAPAAVVPTQGNQPAAAPANRRALLPQLVKVYDWTQTRSTDPDFEEPDWDVPLGYGDIGTLSALVASSPVPVHFANLAARNENGWLDATGITVNDSMELGNQISTLAHELGHYQLGHLDRIRSTRSDRVAAPVLDEDDPQYSVRAVCEQEAALVQFLVMKMLGLDERVGNQITDQAAEYLRNWSKEDAHGNVIALEGHKSRRRALNKRLDAAMRAADGIVSAYMAARAERDQATAA